MMEFFAKIGEKHERLKKKIHSFRIPLSPTGQKIMGGVYFSIPIFIGYVIMQYTNEASAKTAAELRRRSDLIEESDSSTVREQNAALGKLLEEIKEKKKGNQNGK